MASLREQYLFVILAIENIASRSLFVLSHSICMRAVNIDGGGNGRMLHPTESSHSPLINYQLGFN